MMSQLSIPLLLGNVEGTQHFSFYSRFAVAKYISVQNDANMIVVSDKIDVSEPSSKTKSTSSFSLPRFKPEPLVILHPRTSM